MRARGRPQLVGHVGEQLALADEQSFEPVGHLVEGAGEGADLVRPLQAGSGREVPFPEPAGHSREELEGAGDRAGEGRGHDRHDEHDQAQDSEEPEQQVALEGAHGDPEVAPGTGRGGSEEVALTHRFHAPVKGGDLCGRKRRRDAPVARQGTAVVGVDRHVHVELVRHPGEGPGEGFVGHGREQPRHVLGQHVRVQTPSQVAAQEEPGGSERDRDQDQQEQAVNVDLAVERAGPGPGSQRCPDVTRRPRRALRAGSRRLVRS